MSIIDTTFGIIIDKKLFWLIERPKINSKITKNEIIETYKNDGNNVNSMILHFEDEVFTLGYLEEHFDSEDGIYVETGQLQREINLYKTLNQLKKLCNYLLHIF